MTKFYCPNKSIYYFFKINTNISTSFRRSMLISFWIDAPGMDPGGAPGAPPHKISPEKPPKFSRLPPLSTIFLSLPPLAWNPGSAPDINLNMYIINVIHVADDESKIGLYEI